MTPVDFATLTVRFGTPRRATTAFLLGALLVGLFAGSAQPLFAESSKSSANRRLTLLVTSGLAGQLVRGDGTETIASLVAEVRKLADAARARGDAVVVFDAGRTLLPYAESRYDEGHMMGRALTLAGCQAFVPEAMDFTLGLTSVSELAADVPFPVLRPFVGPDPRFEVFAPRTVLEPEAGLRMVLVSLFDPFFAGNLAKSGIAAVMTKPEEHLAAIPESEPGLRVAVVHSAAKGSSMLSRKMTWKLVEQPLGYDLLIDPDFGNDLVLHRKDEDGPVLLIGRKRSREQPWTISEITLDLELQDGRLRPVAASLEVHGVDPETEPDHQLESEIQALVADFRRASRRPLPDAAPTDVAGLRTFVLESIREAAEAEVAILNLGAMHTVAPALLKSRPLPVEVVRRLLPLDQYLVVGELTGRQLSRLASASRKRRGAGGKPLKSSLIFGGLARSATGSLEVNGRKLFPEDRYRVVTNSFLASGGDDYPALTRLLRPETLHLESKRLGEVREDYVLPRLDEAQRPFVDLERRGLWRFGVDRLGISFEGVQTSADDSYRGALDSRASAGNSASLLATVRLRADQLWPSFRWENRLRGRFGLVDAEGEERGELEDDIRLEVSGLFTKARVLGGLFYTSVIVDSEFRRNERFESTLPRQLETNLAAGLRWQRGPWPLIRFGLVARHQEDFEDANRFGIFAEAELEIAGRGRRPAIIGRFFSESLDNSAATIRRLDAEIALRFPIVDSLALTPEFNFYVYDDSRLLGTARYHRLSLGLAYAWNGKHQRR